MFTFRRVFLSALLAASTSLPLLAAGLDPATEARLAADREAIRKADASRRAVLLAPASEQGDRFRALNEFRDQRRKAVLDAAEALLAVRGAVPKEEWQSVVAQVGAGGGMPFLAEQVQKELPAVVAEPARRAAADKTVADLSAEIKKGRADPPSARKKFFRPPGQEELHEGRLHLGDREGHGGAGEDRHEDRGRHLGLLQRTLTPRSGADLVKRLPAPGGPAAP